MWLELRGNANQAKARVFDRNHGHLQSLCMWSLFICKYYMGIGGRCEPALCLQWRVEGWRGSCGEVSPVLSPPSPSLIPLSPLPALSPGLRPVVQTKPQLFALFSLCPPSLQIPVVCWRLALGDNGERGGQGLTTHLSMALSSSPASPFLSPGLVFLLLPRQSCVFSALRPLLAFPVTQTATKWGETCYI